MVVIPGLFIATTHFKQMCSEVNILDICATRIAMCTTRDVSRLSEITSDLSGRSGRTANHVLGRTMTSCLDSHLNALRWLVICIIGMILNRFRYFKF